jgi:hypothetical protein
MDSSKLEKVSKLIVPKHLISEKIYYENVGSQLIEIIRNSENEFSVAIACHSVSQLLIKKPQYGKYFIIERLFRPLFDLNVIGEKEIPIKIRYYPQALKSLYNTTN